MSHLMMQVKDSDGVVRFPDTVVRTTDQAVVITSEPAVVSAGEPAVFDIAEIATAVPEHVAAILLALGLPAHAVDDAEAVLDELLAVPMWVPGASESMQQLRVRVDPTPGGAVVRLTGSRIPGVSAVGNAVRSDEAARSDENAMGSGATRRLPTRIPVGPGGSPAPPAVLDALTCRWGVSRQQGTWTTWFEVGRVTTSESVDPAVLAGRPVQAGELPRTSRHSPDRLIEAAFGDLLPPIG